ncbi:MAG: tRNA pseudouridine(38-40) synthase TruA [Bacteroidetes bacterium]|nr:MAG: tRNA pseudouridine(38-40) synthase TruA [Bacteroidota bacterium]
MRFVVELSYDGTRYHGWQVQQNANSVQAELNSAISKLLSHPVETIGCGRTDTGVHALQFFAHFDYHSPLPPKFVFRLNKILPYDIAIHAAYKVSDEFNTRFDATYRLYEYHMHSKPDPFLVNRSYYRYGPLDYDAMNLAAQKLFDYIDFECFSKTHTQVYTFNCKIMQAKWQKIHESRHVFTIQADRFLRNMVRAIVGSLIDVGSGKLTIQGFEAVIQSKKRTEAGFSAPAHGLYLKSIGYDYTLTPFEKIDE